MEFDGNHRLQPNRRVARLSALELVALPLSRRTSAAVVCRILPLPASCWRRRCDRSFPGQES